MRFPEIEAQNRAEEQQAKAAELQAIQDRFDAIHAKLDAMNAEYAAEKEEVTSSMVVTHLACPSYSRLTNAKMGS
jgi:nucleoid-associated protein YgaU